MLEQGLVEKVGIGSPALNHYRATTTVIAYQVSATLLIKAGNPAVKFMHFLPALPRRGRARRRLGGIP